MKALFLFHFFRLWFNKKQNTKKQKDPKKVHCLNCSCVGRYAPPCIHVQRTEVSIDCLLRHSPPFLIWPLCLVSRHPDLPGVPIPEALGLWIYVLYCLSHFKLIFKLIFPLNQEHPKVQVLFFFSHCKHTVGKNIVINKL